MFAKIPLPILVTIGLIEAVLLYKLLIGETSAILIFAIVLVALLLLLAPYMEKLKSLQLGTDGFKMELDSIKKDIYENSQVIESLIFMSMGADTYTNLLKINSGNFGHYTMPAHQGLETELYYLRNIGFIERIEGSCPSIHEIPPEGDQLSKYVAITENGRKYIELRNELDKKRKQK